MSDRSEANRVSDDLVERVAQRICNTAGSNWNAENFNQTDDGSYPEDQREYYRMLARAAIAVVLEEAAKVAEDEACHCEDTGSAPSDFGNAGRNDAALTIAAAIRALVKGPTSSAASDS